MKLTPDQRRQRIFEMMEENPDFARIKEAYLPAKSWFQKFTALIPGRLGNRLREYPGMMYLMYQRVIDAVCRNMRFPDEE